MSVRLEAEFQALYPRLIAIAGREQATAWLEAYIMAFGREDWERFEMLRAFPLFMRNQMRTGRLETAWLVELALWEWTEFITLYSPAAERSERETLLEDELVLNPTVQILRMEHDFIGWSGDGVPAEEKVMAFMFRKPGRSARVDYLSGDWSTAAIVDVLLENARMSMDELISEIEAHQGGGHRDSWIEKINDLIKRGLVLKKSG